MNIIAIDIGNSNIKIALYVNSEEQYVNKISGDSDAQLRDSLKSSWEKIPIVDGTQGKKRDGVIVASSVKPIWTEKIEKMANDELGEKILLIGRDIPLPIDLWVDEPEKVGTDRIVAAAAAFEVIEEPVVVADFGTAVTIDLVNQNGIFEGGAILPGFELCSTALHEYTAQLPKVHVTRPAEPYGKNTADAINCGLYYSAVASLQEVVRRYAEKLGKWPHTIITGAGAKIIKDDCDFVDSYVADLVVKGIVLTYKLYLEKQKD